MLGDFSKAVDDAVIDSNDAHRNQMMQTAVGSKKGSWICEGGGLIWMKLSGWGWAG